MSNHFETSDGYAVCHHCQRTIPAGEQYIWLDIASIGQNHCKNCVELMRKDK